jgi:hypothetical protein
MWIFYLSGAGVLALFGYMALLDLRARRRGRRLGVSGRDVRLGRQAAQAEFAKHNPGGEGPFRTGGFGGGPGV